MAVIGQITIDELQILEVDADPSTSAPSINYFTSTLAVLRDGSGVGKVWLKSGNAIDAWTDLSTGGGSSTLSGLTDVILTSPVVDQVLKYNGTHWINGSITQTNAGAGVDYFLTNTASGISTYDLMSKTPDTAAEVDESISVTNQTLAFEQYISDAEIGGSQIDPGIWNFNIYTYVSVSSGVNTLTVNVYKRTSGGTETLLFSATSDNIDNLVATLYPITTVQPAFSVNATDKLLFKIDATTTSITPVTIHLVHSGTTHYTYINTPLITRHNDLAGLNAGDYQHLTASEYTGTGTGTFVRQASPTFTGTVSGLTKSMVGLGNVDNTTDTSKAISGDVTGTLGASTVANSAITLAKMANVATSSVFYRKTAGTGAPEVQALSTLKTDLGLTGTNSGDQTITLTGNVTGSGTSSFATTIANNAVSNAMLAQITSATFKGRVTAGTGNVETLTSTQATSILNVMSGDFGAGGTKGLVPAQNIGDATKFLKGDGTWGSPGGSGDMLSTNNLSDVANTTTARNNILPSKTGNSLKVLRVNSGETDYELATVSGGGGRVWSTSNSGTVSLSSSSDRGLIFTGAVDGRLLNLPNATTMTIGDNFEIINYTDCIIRVLDFGSNKINVIWPGQSIEIYPVDVSSSNGVWVFNNYGNTYNQQPALFDDFISAGTATNTVGNLGWTLTSTNGTGSLVYQAVTNPRMGVLRISTATANNAAVALSLGTTTPIVVGGGRIICEFYANLPSLGGTGAAALTVQIGLQDSTGSSETANGIYLSYAGTAAGTINWTAKTSSASTRTSTSTGVAAAAGTWVKFTIVINAAGTAVSYYNNDQYLFDITTNIPTAPIAPNIHIFAGASNAAAKSMDIDFYSLTTSSTTIR